MSWRVQGTAGKPRRQKRSITAAGKPRKKPVDWEGQEQAVLMRWLLGEKNRGTPVGELHDVTYHPANGGQRNKKTAADLKRQGVKAGVSDLVVMEARGAWFGLYLEFKATPPRHAALADSQREWLAQGEARGYCAVLARGLEEAKKVLRWYASLRPTMTIDEAVRAPPVGEKCPHGTEWRKEIDGDGDGGTGDDGNQDGDDDAR